MRRTKAILRIEFADIPQKYPQFLVEYSLQRFFFDPEALINVAHLIDVLTLLQRLFLRKGKGSFLNNCHHFKTTMWVRWKPRKSFISRAF